MKVRLWVKVSLCVSVAFGATAAVAPGQTFVTPTDPRICDTEFIASPGSSLEISSNWSNGLPRPGSVACLPGEGSVSGMRERHSAGATILSTRPPTQKRRGTLSRAADGINPPRRSLRGPAAIEAPRGLKPAAQGNEIWNGAVAGSQGGTVLYLNEIDPAVFLRVPGAGELVADDLSLSIWPADVTSYTVGVFGLGQSGAATFDVSTALWDGDPCSAESSVISGTAADFFDLANDGSTQWVLDVELLTPVSVPRTVWLAVTFSTPDAGWLIAEQAEIGITQDRFWEDDGLQGCIPFVFVDGQYAGFWATVTGIVGGIPDGACCLGSECVLADAFDCRELGGHFLEGVVACLDSTCARGACCAGDLPLCEDGDALGGDMDESLCELRDGAYVGGAACGNSDPCEPFRIPQGFEVIDVSSSQDGGHKAPRMNDCGEIVFAYTPSDDAVLFDREVYLSDNGKLVQVTDDLANANVGPDINDHGTIVYVHGADGFGAGEIVLVEQGSVTVLGRGGGAPRINNLGHVVWSLLVSPSCPGPHRDDLYFYDGAVTRLLFTDDLSNQSPAINNHDQVIWTDSLLECGGGFGDWTSEILLLEGGNVISQPVTLLQCQGANFNEQGRKGWSCTNAIIRQAELLENGVSRLLPPGSCCLDMNNRREVAYQSASSITTFEILLDRDGETYRISNEVDLENSIANDRAALNEYGEIAWRWRPDADLVPSGIRLMRRIRNGDVNFDGLVDLEDFIPFPGCYTGPVPTDRLCECRFFDIDHDRDIDLDDFELFLRVYAGPLEDCNDNGTLDLDELLDGTLADCNLNGRPDGCDLADDPTLDIDGDGMIDACCRGTIVAPLANGPLGVVATNRFISFSAGDSSDIQAVRVTLFDLPEPFDGQSGQALWLGQPREVTELSGVVDPLMAEGHPTFWGATLQCEPFHTDWSQYGTVHIYHQSIIPGGVYDLQAIKQNCERRNELNFSTPLTVGTSAFGNVSGPFDSIFQRWTEPEPDGTVDITTDVIAAIAKFGNRPGSPMKIRVDLDPETPDFKINIIDIVRILDAFRGLPYPFAPPSIQPCGKQ